MYFGIAGILGSAVRSSSSIVLRSLSVAAVGQGISVPESSSIIRWVFLGAPGVGKGTYASRAAKHFGVAHIATGDLIRSEIKAGSTVGKQISDLVQKGSLVSDDLILELLQRRLASGKAAGEHGYILDGFPRTLPQAEKLLSAQKIQLAFNLGLREEVLIEKCLGRRICKHCGKNYNIANIHLAASADNSRPEIRMPPLDPPPECAGHLEIRDDDTEQVVRRRLHIYKEQAVPVENFFQSHGLLHNFEITSGIPETLPSLLRTLQRFVPS